MMMKVVIISFYYSFLFVVCCCCCLQLLFVYFVSEQTGESNFENNIHTRVGEKWKEKKKLLFLGGGSKVRAAGTAISMTFHSQVNSPFVSANSTVSVSLSS